MVAITTVGGDRRNPVRPIRSRLTIDLEAIAIRPKGDGLSTLGRYGIIAQDVVTPDKLVPNRFQSDFNNALIARRDWDVSVTHGDGVRAASHHPARS